MEDYRLFLMYRSICTLGSYIRRSKGSRPAVQSNACSRGASTIPHIYPSVLQALPGRGRAGCLRQEISGVRAGAMQDLGYELPRIPIPRTPVNRLASDTPRAEDKCVIQHTVLYDTDL